MSVLCLCRVCAVSVPVRCEYAVPVLCLFGVCVEIVPIFVHCAVPVLWLCYVCAMSENCVCAVSLHTRNAPLVSLVAALREHAGVRGVGSSAGVAAATAAPGVLLATLSEGPLRCVSLLCRVAVDELSVMQRRDSAPPV